MITPITAIFPALNFPKEVDYPTQEDWSAFSAAAELNYGILSGEWSLKSELYKNQMNTLALQIQDIGENAINAITFDNISQLKLNSNMGRVDLLGYYIKGDGGGGTFYWDSTSTETDNGGTIIQATGVTTGRWKRVINNRIDVKWFGAKGDGTTNDTASIKKCLALTNIGKILFPKGTYKVNESLSLNIWDYDIEGEQAIIDFSGLNGTTYPFAITFPTSVELVNKHSIGNITFLGNNTTADFMDLSLTGSGHIAHIGFNNITIVNFKNQIVFGQNSSNIYFTKCKFYHQDTQYRTGDAIYIASSATTNSGEQLSFSQCQFGGNKYVVEGVTLTGAINMMQCALVYFESCISINVGTVNLSQCSIESNTHTKEWFIADGEGKIKITHSDFVFATTALNNYVFKSASTNLFGGINISDCTYYINPLATITIDCFSNKSNYGKVQDIRFLTIQGGAKIPMGLNNGSQLVPLLPDNTLFKNLLLPYSDDGSTLALDNTVLFNGLSTTSLTTSVMNMKRVLKIDSSKNTNDFLGYVYLYSSTTAGIQITMTFYNRDGIALASYVPYSGNPTANTWFKVNLNYYPMPPVNYSYIGLDLYGAGVARKLNIGEIVING